MKKIALALAALLCLFALIACAPAPAEADPAGKVYVYEKEGFGGAFTISLLEGGKMSYYEGMLSSHVGEGTWSLEDGILTISEDNGRGGRRVNRFRVTGDELAFIAGDSDNFIYLEVADGETFSSRAKTQQPYAYLP